MLNLVKLAVGARTEDDIAERQAARAAAGGAVSITTRQFPKRAAELEAGGSLYWVVAGLVSVRQEIVGIREIRRDDGTRGTSILLHRTLHRVAPRPMRAFQGWRYFEGEAVPPDLAVGAGGSGDTLPPALARALASLCLI